MTLEEYEFACAISRSKLLDKRQEAILLRMEEYPTTSAAQVCDWLKEHYGEDCPERTVGRYVKELREQHHNLKKSIETCSYEAVVEQPMGKRMPVDFGEKWMNSMGGGRVKVRFTAFALSHSRHKYVEFHVLSFKADRLPQLTLFGPASTVSRIWAASRKNWFFDQDSIVTVIENCSDVVHMYLIGEFLCISIYC